MSVIGRKPFINTIIDNCDKTQIENIVTLLNDLGTPTLVALYGDDNLISSSNIGVSYVTLKMNEVLALIPTGILVYLDNSHCGFFVVNTNSDNITEYVIDPVARTYLIVNEYLTVEEMRQVCGDRLVEVGGGVSSNARPNSVAVGQYATAYNASVSVGTSAGQSSTTYTTNLGYYAWSTTSNGVAIGYQTRNYISYGISFDGDTAKSTCRTLQLYDADKIFFRNAQQSSSKTTFASYTQGHYLSEYIYENTLELTESSGVYTSTKTFAGSEIKGVHVKVVLDSMAVCSFDLEKYNSDEGAYTAFAICTSNKDLITAEMDSTGAVVITPPSGTSITKATYYLR